MIKIRLILSDETGSIKKRSSRDVILRRKFIASFGRELGDRRQSGRFKWISKLS